MQLVSAIAGLTNMYPEQVIRNPVIDMSSQLVDSLLTENISGGLSRSSLIHAGAMAGGLNAQASGFASIMGGWGSSRGLMKLKLIIENNALSCTYLNVIGYINNNNAEGLSLDAVFVPQSSWKTREQVTASFHGGDPTQIRRQVAHRTDYMMDDGSGMNNNISMRPGDVIDYSLVTGAQEALVENMEEMGLEGVTATPSVAGSDIGLVGVVASKRDNLNPSSYALDILTAGVNLQSATRQYQGMELGFGTDQSNNAGLYGELANIGHQAANQEPILAKDEFFHEMLQVLGRTSMRGFTGFSIADILMVFPNMNDVLDLNFMDASRFTLLDYNQTSYEMGSSQITEFVSHEIMMNVCDLMMRYDLTSISFRGSNCDNFGGDGGLSNIVILPYNACSMQDDDYQLGDKVQQFVNNLLNQIFLRLNGLNVNSMVPIRFDVTAELFGTTVINIAVVDDTNISSGFSVNSNGSVDGMQQRTFPTFAVNNGSSMLGNSQTAMQAGANFFSNIQSYFS